MRIANCGVLRDRAAEHRLEFKVLDIEGRMYSVDIVAIDSQHDLCVVYAKDLWQPAIALGVDKPTPGDRVYNIAAPVGHLCTNRWCQYLKVFIMVIAMTDRSILCQQKVEVLARPS